ncbi:sushi domain-containing protein 1 isoform X3 [Chamaea fasciata]|uniref:sushi domain-containing protein 1 isoform X3 n=1 Tax=Chamaea fasciata TaxID=190680 RepID=UPI00336A51A1
MSSGGGRAPGPLLLLLLLALPRCAGRRRAVVNRSIPDVCATCHIHATCQQSGGKSVCICNYGFVGNGRTHCQDKDECQIGASKICGNHTLCHNTHGSFYCVCLDGYRASNNNKTFIPNDGTNCTDIDECEESGLCGHNARCVNTEGSYMCYCNDGYKLETGEHTFHRDANNVSCKGVDCGIPPLISNAHSTPVSGTTYGNEVTYDCVHGYLMAGNSRTAICNAKGQWDGPDLVCKEIDCGKPWLIPHTTMTWNNATTLWSRVYYHCKQGYYFNGDKNFSECTIDQSWENITYVCEDPPFPEVEFVAIEGSAPLLRLRKAEDQNGPVSLYQVIVLPLDLQSTFICDSFAATTFFNNTTGIKGYVAAEFQAKDVADNMSIALGDRQYYGKFYNAPLKLGEEYCVFLKIISEWNKVRTQSCAVWAQIKNLSPSLQYMTAVGLASVAAVCLILFLSFSVARSCLRSAVHPPPTVCEAVHLSTTLDVAPAGIASSFLETESVSLL